MYIHLVMQLYNHTSELSSSYLNKTLWKLRFYSNSSSNRSDTTATTTTSRFYSNRVKTKRNYKHKHNHTSDTNTTEQCQNSSKSHSKRTQIYSQHIRLLFESNLIFSDFSDFFRFSQIFPFFIDKQLFSASSFTS